MRKLLLLFSLSIFFFAHAQKREVIDSLKNEILALTLDTTTVRVLNKLAGEYWYRNPDSTRYYAKLAGEYAQKLDDKKGYIGSIRHYGISFYLMSDYDSAAYFYEKALAELKEFPDTKLEAATLGAIGIIYKLRNETTKALATYEQAYRLADSVGMTSRAGIMLNNIGNIYLNYADYPKALDYYRKALVAQKKVDNEQAISMCFGNIGLVYSSIGDSSKAIQYLDSSLQIVRRIGDRNGVASALYNIGTIYAGGNGNEKKSMLDKAMVNFHEALQINRELKDQRSIAFSYASLGIIHEKLLDYDSSLWYYELALELQEGLGDKYSIAITNYNLAKLFNDQKKHRQARVYAQKVIEISDSIKSFDLVRDGAWIMMDIEESAGNIEKAFEYAQILMTAKDSIYNDEKSREIGRLESQFELDKMDYKNQLQERDNQLLKEEAQIKQSQLDSQRTIIIFVVLLLFVSIVFALILRKRSVERKKLLDEIQHQSVKLKELDQAKTRFFANISHDLRSPLTLILGALDKISEKEYDILDTESKEMLDTGVRNGKRLLYLADEIMDLTRLEEGKISLKLEHVKIVPYLRLLTKMFSSAAEIKDIQLKFKADAEDEAILLLDPHQFEKIIYNLLSNAIKFTPNNGQVTVSLHVTQAHIEVAIADSGVGIPEENLHYIFDRYYQSANNIYTSQAGVGIGLALVRELTELHNGTISVQSSPSGTTFLAKFPYKESDWVSQAIIPERSLDVVTRNSLWMDLQEEHERTQISSLTNSSPDAKTVLIVEDHKELRFYLKSILSSNFRIFMASNGADGLNVLQTEKIDLIITDLMMPYMDGFELIDQLKNDKELRKIPVMVVSARTDKEEKIDLIKKGAEDVISKPFDKEELFAKIKNILDRDWDSTVKLNKIYGETTEDFEKNIMAKLERLIIKRIDDAHLSVLDLADEMAASERKVYRMIKKISGLTPYELIKEVRWQYLEDYLKKNKVYSAKEAGQLIGINNSSLFSTQYEKRFGKSFKNELS